MDTWFSLLTIVCFIALVAGVRWGIDYDSSPILPTADAPAVLAGGFELHQVPLENRHRTHGKHRAG